MPLTSFSSFIAVSVMPKNESGYVLLFKLQQDRAKWSEYTQTFWPYSLK